MATLKDLTRSCGSPIPPGLKTKLYLIPTAEITAFPAVTGTATAGDSKLLGADFTYVSTVDLGFWRVWDILVDTGDLRSTLEGEIGGQGYRQRLDFFVLGSGAVQYEAADDLLSYSGCVLAAIADKSGNMNILGDLENPVYIEAAEGGPRLERVGFQYTLYANTGFTPFIQDTDAYPLNLTPNTI